MAGKYHYEHVRCHSPFKHYEMFHGNKQCGGSDSYGSVFNTTYNINSGGCGGGNFWSGFGWGLGNGLAGLFSGFMGGMFGSFNMFGGGCFGGGFNLFGGGFGFGNGMFSLGAGLYDTFWGGSSGKSKKTSKSHECKCNTETNASSKKCTNKDEAGLKTFDGKVEKLNDGKVIPTRDNVKKLYDEIVKAQGEQDDIHKDADNAHYEQLKSSLQKIAKDNKWGDFRFN